MSSEVFESTEDDVRIIFDNIKGKIQHELPNTKGENRKKICRDIERKLEETAVLLNSMEEEARKAPTKYRYKMMNSVKHYRQEADRISYQLTSMKNNAPQVEPGIASFYDEDDFESIENSQRARLLQGTQSLTETSNTLARIHRVAAETDEIGTEIITELSTQRESLVRTKDKLHHTDENLSKSRKILQSIGRRMMTNKLILAVIIVLEVAVLGGVVYWKFFA